MRTRPVAIDGECTRDLGRVHRRRPATEPFRGRPGVALRSAPERVAVRTEGRFRRRGPGEALARALARPVAEPAPELAVVEQGLNRVAEGLRVTRRHEAPRSRRRRRRRQARRPRSRRPGGRMPSPRARRRRSPRDATARRRSPRARSTAPSSPGGTKPTASGTRRAAGRLRRRRERRRASPPASSRTPFSAESRPTKRTCGGSSGSATPRESRRRSERRVRRARRARAQPKRAPATAQSTSRARRNEPPHEPGHPASELDVGPPQLNDERLAASRARATPEASQCACTRSASRAARRAARAYDARKAGTSSAFHGARAEVADDAVPVREPEVPERRGRDDLDVDPGRPQVLDGIADEGPGDVVRHRGYDVVRTTTFIRAARRADDHGSAAASVANT